MNASLQELLQRSSARHSHLCPRQVLGVRMGLAGLRMLALQAPLTKHTGLVIVETDGCFADGVEAATGAAVGHRTLRVNDLGKIAATFADIITGRTIRLSVRQGAREQARLYAPDEERHYFAQLRGYQLMPDEELFAMQEVVLEPSLATLISRPGVRVVCELCGEEVINDRQVERDGMTLCRTCAYGSYYTPRQSSAACRALELQLPLPGYRRI